MGDGPETETDPGVGDRYRKSSPWPMFVALGLVLSEVGVVIGLLPVAVGGLLLFGGSVAGILREAGYVGQPWTSLVALGGLLLLAGGGLVVWQLGVAPRLVADALARPAGYGQVVPRALAIALAGGLLVAAGGTGRLVDDRTPG